METKEKSPKLRKLLQALTLEETEKVLRENKNLITRRAFMRLKEMSPADVQKKLSELS